MDRFTDLFMTLDATSKTTVKLNALADYFERADQADSLWALWLLSGNTLRRAVTSTQLKDWATDEAGLPRWLFDESYIRVGDLAETVSLVVRQAAPADASAPLTGWMERIGQLREQTEAERRDFITGAWRRLTQPQRLIFTKLITGSFRVGVSRALTVRALAGIVGADRADLLHALTGDWHPATTTLTELLATPAGGVQPYPFFLASPVGDLEKLGPADGWLTEWKWDGIRGQLIRRGGETALWSRGEDQVSQQFPELIEAAGQLPDGTVLDGEILAWQEGGALPFATLQTRLGRKSVSDKLRREAPVAFVAYDILEHAGRDLRETPLRQRRTQLESVLAGLDERITVSPVITAEDWPAYGRYQADARARRAEGLMLKRLDSPYRAGRVRGDWWKWKVDPLSVDAVMINAQRGHGRRSGVYSDYTFAVWDGDQLVPFAKAYSGLTDAEINQVDSFVKRHTLEKFGPVRTVTPQLVFEIGFEGITASKRHKSGVAVRFPRILRRRPDKPLSEIDTVQSLHRLLEELA